MNNLAYIVKDLYNIGLRRHERRIIDTVLDSPGFAQPVFNIRPKSVQKIAFIVPGIDKYSGGITSVLRLGTYLAQFGHEITYADYTNASINELCKNASDNLLGYQGKIASVDSLSANAFDVVIATNWQSVYCLNKFNAYKMYFVQDYEPFFFNLSERYLLAKLTYELGLHIVSLGSWNVKQIQRECPSTPSILEYIDFPFEPKEYPHCARNYSSYEETKKYVLAVYTKEDGKRIPNIMQSLLYRTSSVLSGCGLQLDIRFFGAKKSFKPCIGKNLGKLSKSEMLELYKKSDFGMVASMSNISLVPYEMLATGLPVIEFKSGSFESFFPSEAGILIDYNYQTLANRLLSIHNDASQLTKMLEQANAILGKSNWFRSALQFEKILKKIVA